MTPWHSISIKNFFLGLALCFVLAPMAQAQAPPADHPWYLGLGTGADLPGSGDDPDYYLGGGPELFGGCRMDAHWGAQLGMEEWYFAGGGTALDDLRVLLEAKYTFEGEGLRPYLLAGPGISFRESSPSGVNNTDFDFAVGAGLEADLGSDKHLFLEAKYNLDLAPGGSAGDVPITAGLWVGL